MKLRLDDSINWTLTIILIIAVLYAGHQRYFEEQKCNNYCSKEFNKAQFEMNDITYNCDLNWSKVYAQEQDYAQNINGLELKSPDQNLAENLQNQLKNG